MEPLGYSFHGTKIVSAFSLEVPTSAQTDKEHKILRIREKNGENEMGRSIWESKEVFPNGKPHFSLYRSENTYQMLIPSVGFFSFSNDEIECVIQEKARPAPYLLCKVFAMWLELCGCPVLHGATLKHKGYAYGLLGPSGMGKSTLSAYLNGQEHWPLITDDLMPIDKQAGQFYIHPGIPVSRMWPDTAIRFLGDVTGLERVHPDWTKLKVPDQFAGRRRFTTSGAPLGGLFILRRESAGPVQVKKLPPAAALLELVSMSYHGECVLALGIQQERLKLLAALISGCPVYRLSYPSGFEHLPEVCQEIVAVAAQQAKMRVEKHSGSRMLA